MTYNKLARTTTNQRARTTTRRIRIRRIRVAGLLVVIAAIAALGYQFLASSSSTAASPIDVLRGEPRGALGEALPSTVWPTYGQAAVQMGHSQVQAGPNQHVPAIAGTVHNTNTLLGHNGFVGVNPISTRERRYE